MVKAQSISGNFRILIKCERFCEGFASSTKGFLSPVWVMEWNEQKKLLWRSESAVTTFAKVSVDGKMFTTDWATQNGTHTAIKYLRTIIGTDEEIKY